MSHAFWGSKKLSFSNDFIRKHLSPFLLAGHIFMPYVAIHHNICLSINIISSITIYPFSCLTITFTWSMLTSNSTLYFCLSFTIHVSCHHLSLSPSIFLLVSRVTGSWTSLCSLRVHLPRSLRWSRLSSECLMDLVLHGEVNEQKHASHRTNRFTGLR